MKIQTSKIVPNPQQPRSHFNHTEMLNLVASIRQNGLLHPIVVEEGDGVYILIDGERRWRAVKELGWTEVDATIRPSSNGTATRDRTILALVANMQRQDLTPIEEARAFESLSAMGLSNVEIAHRAGTSSAKVSNRRALLQLEEEIQDLVEAGMLPSDSQAVRSLLQLPAETRVELARKLARPGLTIKAVSKAVDRLQAALIADRVSGEPAMHFAAQKTGQAHLPNWDALRQLGTVPPWDQVVAAANYTCKTCVLRQEASAVVCKECPAVTMLARLIEASQKPASQKPTNLKTGGG